MKCCMARCAAATRKIHSRTSIKFAPGWRRCHRWPGDPCSWLGRTQASRTAVFRLLSRRQPSWPTLPGRSCSGCTAATWCSPGWLASQCPTARDPGMWRKKKFRCTNCWKQSLLLGAYLPSPVLDPGFELCSLGWFRVGLGWVKVGSSWVGLGWVGSDRVGFRLIWVGLGWVGLGWVRVGFRPKSIVPGKVAYYATSSARLFPKSCSKLCSCLEIMLLSHCMLKNEKTQIFPNPEFRDFLLFSFPLACFWKHSGLTQIMLAQSIRA